MRAIPGLAALTIAATLTGCAVTAPAPAATRHPATTPPASQGPALTGFVTRRLAGAQVAKYTEWISNGRELRDLLTQMQHISDHARDLILGHPPQDRQPGS